MNKYIVLKSNFWRSTLWKEGGIVSLDPNWGVPKHFKIMQENVGPSKEDLQKKAEISEEQRKEINATLKVMKLSKSVLKSYMLEKGYENTYAECLKALEELKGEQEAIKEE